MEKIEDKKEEVYYLYRHLRKDCGQPFYVGIGKVYRPNAKSYEKYYARAFQMTKRNRFWQFVYDKVEIEVEILLETNSVDFIEQKEIEFIALYGRRDLGKGTLVNLNDGGGGMRNNIQSEETLEKRRRLYREGKTSLKGLKGKDNPRSKQVIETSTGRIFDSGAEASKYLGITQGEFSSQITNCKNRKNNTGFKFVDESLNKEYTDKKRNVKIYDYATENIYDSISEAARIFEIEFKSLKGMLRGTFNNRTSLVFYDDYLKGIKPDELYVCKKVTYKVIDTETKEIYNSMMALSKAKGFSKATTESRLKGKLFNPTPYQLLSDYEKGLPINHNYVNNNKTKVIDTVTLKVYETITDAAKELGINYNTFANYLNPNCTNPNLTSMVYLSDYETQ